MATREAHEGCNTEHEQQIDNSCTILEKIANLYAERLLSDIILEVGGERFAAHRLILCASSDVFQVMLMNPAWSESQESRIVLQEDPQCVKVFPDFLKYLYIGRIRINHLHVLPLLTLADKYNVKDLVKLCVEYMSMHIVSAAKHNLVVSWLQYTLNCGHNDVYDACFEFVKHNLELVVQMDDFGNLEAEVLIALLQKSDLVIRDEYTLFNCVTTWLSIQESKMSDEAEVEYLVPLVMQHIRFPNITPRQLANLLLNPFVIRFKEFFVNQMSLAMAFHSNRLKDYLAKESNESDAATAATTTTTTTTPTTTTTTAAAAAVTVDCTPKKQKLSQHFESCSTYLESSSVKYVPRLYTAEKWSSTLVIENYRNLPVYGVRTLVFQTPSSLTESDNASTQVNNEWVVDLYPKGVWFKKFFLIVWQGTLEMPEYVAKTVRLSLTTLRSFGRVTIGLLIYGKQNGIEHVYSVVHKEFRFTSEERMLNINDLIPFEALNVTGDSTSPYLVGPNNDTLKIQIVITPISYN